MISSLLKAICGKWGVNAKGLSDAKVVGLQTRADVEDDVVDGGGVLEKVVVGADENLRLRREALLRQVLHCRPVHQGGEQHDVCTVSTDCAKFVSLQEQQVACEEHVGLQ